MIEIILAGKSENVIRTFVVSDEIAKAVDTLLLAIRTPTDLERFAQETAEKALRDARQASCGDPDEFSDLTLLIMADAVEFYVQYRGGIIHDR